MAIPSDSDLLRVALYLLKIGERPSPEWLTRLVNAGLLRWDGQDYVVTESGKRHLA